MIIGIGSDIDPSGEPRTFPSYLARQVVDRGDALAVRHKLRGRWRTWTWRGLARDVATFSAGLAKLGFVRGDLLALVGQAGPRQLVAALAAQQRGGVPLPVDPALPEDGLRALLAGSCVRFAFASNEAQVDRISRASDVPPAIVFDDPRGLRRCGRKNLHDYEDVCASGRSTTRPPEAPGERRAFSFWPTDACGAPRATVLTHRELLASGRAIASEGTLSTADEVLAEPSLASPGAAEMIATWLIVGFPLSFPETDGNRDDDRRDILPTHLLAPAEAYHRLWRDVCDRLPSPGTRQRRLLDAALRHGARWRVEGDSTPRRTVGARLLRALGEACVMRPLARTVGLGRVRVAFALGSEPLSADATIFLSALGIPVRLRPSAPQVAPVDEDAPRSAFQAHVEPPTRALS